MFGSKKREMADALCEARGKALGFHRQLVNEKSLRVAAEKRAGLPLGWANDVLKGQCPICGSGIEKATLDIGCVRNEAYMAYPILSHVDMTKHTVMGASVQYACGASERWESGRKTKLRPCDVLDLSKKTAKGEASA